MKPIEEMSYDELKTYKAEFDANYSKINKAMREKEPKSTIEKATPIMKEFDRLEFIFDPSINLKPMAYLSVKLKADGTAGTHLTIGKVSVEKAIRQTQEYIENEQSILQQATDLLDQVRKIADEFQMDYHQLVNRTYFGY